MNMNEKKCNVSKNEKVNLLIERVHNHLAWYGQIGVDEAERILEGCPASTYLLRCGENELHYFFSYVVQGTGIFHKCIRINAQAVGYYPNGGGGCCPNELYNTVEQLISKFLGCRESDLTPLQNLVSHAQGF